MTKIKNALLFLWQCLVLIAYIKFYIICLVTYVMVCVLSLYVLSEAGTDIVLLGEAMQISIWFAFFWTVVIIIDKAIVFGYSSKNGRKS